MMKTNRRTAIKYFVLLTAGAAFLPSCKTNKAKDAAFNNIPIDEDQQTTLSEISETIIPATDTPGAKAVSAHVFALQMLNDCYEQPDRDRFMKGFTEFESGVKKKYSKPFLQCTKAEREAIIAEADEQKKAITDASFFYNMLKQLTIKGYTESKYFLTNVHEYKLVPGKFKNSVPV